MRVLHLLDAASPQSTGTTFALLTESLGRLGHFDQQVVLLGGTSLTRSAVIAGVQAPVTLNVPLGQPLLAGWQLYRYARRHGPFDVIHCWSISSLSLTTLLFPTLPRILTLLVTPCRRSVHWASTLLRDAPGRTVLLPISSTIRQAVLAGGATPSAVHVVRPGIDLGKIELARRSALRKAWNAKDQNVKILALLSDPSERSDAAAAGMAMTMAQESQAAAGFDLRMLVHPNQTHRYRCQYTQHHLGRRASIIQEAALDQPWTVLPACDLALAVGSGAGGLSLLWAMAGNIPIVGEATNAISEIVEHDHSALLAPPGSAQKIAFRMTQLLNDKQLAWRLCDTARHEAYSYFSRQRYCKCLRTVYLQMTQGRQVEVPPMEITGGLRFAGRA